MTSTAVTIGRISSPRSIPAPIWSRAIANVTRYERVPACSPVRGGQTPANSGSCIQRVTRQCGTPSDASEVIIFSAGTRFQSNLSIVRRESSRITGIGAVPADPTESVPPGLSAFLRTGPRRLTRLRFGVQPASAVRLAIPFA